MTKFLRLHVEEIKNYILTRNCTIVDVCQLDVVVLEEKIQHHRPQTELRE